MRTVKKKITRPMYNKKQKQEYIEFERGNSISEKVLTSYTNYFIRVAEGEKKYKKDIADMNEKEFRDTITILGIPSEESRGHLLSLLRNYKKWAKLYGKSNVDYINDVSAVSIDAKHIIATKMLKSPEQVEEILDKAFDDGNYTLENKEAIYSLIIWLLYSGLELKELQLLKKTDIDYANRTITGTNNIQHEVNDKILALCEKCSKMKYIEKVGTKSISGKIKNDLVDNEYLFRPIEGNKKNRKSQLNLSLFAIYVSRVFERYNQATGETINVTPKKIRESGIFYKMYKSEKNGLLITNEVIAKFFQIDSSDKTDLSSNTRKLRIDYADWKLTFGYMNESIHIK